MTVVYTRTTATVVGSVDATLITMPSFTSTNGNLLIAGIGVRDSTSSPLIGISGGGLTWTVVQTGSAGASTLDYGVWVATSDGNVMTITGTYTAAGSKGESMMVVTEVASHNGLGVSYSTSTTTAGTSLINGSLVTTSNNSGVWVFGAGRIAVSSVDTLITAGFSVATAGSSGNNGSAVTVTVAIDDDVGNAASIPFVWGTTGGINVGARSLVMIEIIQASGTVTFNYDLLEHRVMRGAGRGVMRGVA